MKKDILNYEGLYQIDELGNVYPHPDKDLCGKNCEKIAVLDNGNGYKKVSLNKHSKKKQYYIHRLVAQAFIPNPENKPAVNHKNGDKENNSIDNLEWVTASENNQHAQDTGLSLARYSEKQKTAVRNTAKKLRKLSWDIVCFIRENHKYFSTQAEIANLLNVPRPTVCEILKGKKYIVA